MEYNIINEIEYTVSEEQLSLFTKIVEKVENLLEIKEQYVFSLILVDSARIHEINREYRGIDRPTDVISFALMDSEDAFECMEEEIEIGDIFVNIDAVKTQAEEYGHSFEREFSFLFTHGVLHLLGYDHMVKEEEEVMFALQDKVLDGIIER